jgi:hypothetical protein
MNLRIGFHCEVTGNADEASEVYRLNQFIERKMLNEPLTVELDESLLKDWNRVMNDLGEIIHRARGRKTRRKR